jgi:MoaA/NifB/PqqE/SkfB family radical SAM enzyme
MKAIELNIGKICNNACLFCGNGNAEKWELRWVDDAIVIKELEEAAAAGYDSVGFLGGEMTVYPHAVKVVAAAKSLGFSRIVITTNGRKLADKAVLDGLLDAGATRITFSIHSHKAEIEDKINARKRAFEQKIAGIKNCVEAERAGRLKDGLSLNTCVHGLNNRSLTEMAGFFRALGIHDIRFNLVRPEQKAIGSRELVPKLGDTAPELVRLVSENERSLKMTITFGDLPLCVWPPVLLRTPRFARRYIGELRDLPTRVTVFGSDTKPDDRFIWGERKIGKHKQFVKACEKCPAARYCEGIWTEYVNLYGEGEFKPVAL